MSQILVTGEAKIRDIQGPVVANSGVVTALDGDASQYVRGDGTLADFPTSTGGGSSVSYYLNSSVSQGTIGGVAYKQLGKTPISGAGTDITISTTGYIASYLTDANDPALLEVPAGNFNCEFYFSVNNNTGNPFVYAEVYKYDGTTFTLLGTSVGVPEYITEGTVINPYYFAVPVAVSALSVTDRIAIRIYVNVDGRIVTLHTENNHLCQVVTTFSKGLISLNNLTRQNQFFGTGTSGTDFAISSSTATHTFNLPVASATNTGKLSSTDWTTFNGKYNLPSLTSGSVLFSNGTTIAQNNANFFWDNTNSFLGVGTNVPSAGVTSFSATAATQFKAAGTAPAITFSNTLTSASLACVFGLATSNNQFITGTAAGDMAIANQSTSAGAIVFGTGTTEKMRMTSAGTFSIGNTNSTFNLDVTGTGRFTGVLTLGSTISNGTFTYTLPSATGTLALTSQLTGGTVTSVGLSSATSGVTIGSSPITTSGTITLAIATASGSQNGLLSSTDWTTFNSKGSGSVTSVAALTIGTTGTNITSSVANSTTTPVITLNIPNSSATNRGALTAADWITFTNKQDALNGTGFVKAIGTDIFYDNSTYLTTSAAASTYLPLIGGTLTGALNINVNSGTGLNVATENVVFRASPTYGFPRQLVFSMGSGPTTTLEAKGYGANYITDFNIKTYNSAGTGFDVFFGTSAGDVGIGNNTPAAKLDVNGTFKATGAATFSSSVTGQKGVNVGANALGADRMFQVSGTSFTVGSTQFGIVNNPTMTTLTTIYGYYGGVTVTSATNGYGIYIVSAAGTITNKFGIYQEGSGDVNYFAGNVGIGTYSPTPISTFTTLEIRGATGGGIKIGKTGFAQFNIQQDGGDAYFNNTANGSIFFYTNDTERMRITSGGAIGLNGNSDVTNVQDKFSFGYYNSNYGWLQTWSGTPLYLNKVGNAVYAGTQRIDNNSDQRIKENIVPIENALDVVLSLNGRKFNMLDENGKLRYGFVAQEVQPHLADFVTESDRTFKKDDIKIENLLTLESSGASWAAILVEAIKEQQAQIQELKAKIK